MPDTDVLYADVKFTKTGRKATDTPSPAHDTTYSQVNIVRTQPPTEQSGSQQQTNGRSKVTPERVALVVLSVLLIASISAFIFTYFKSMENKGFSALQQNTTCTCPGKQSIPVCDEAWERYGGKQYYFTTFNSTWDISRMFCRELGADLVKIDSEAEQRFLLDKAKNKMSENEHKFWIGLTDAKTEGTWLWVDDSPLNDSLTFWLKGEPDDWTVEDPNGEDCARMGELGEVTDPKRWLDKSCKKPQRSICAKPAKSTPVN